MKVILTGVTGFIGHETLLQCLASPDITSIVALSRRALPDNISKSEKLQVVMVPDFMNYTPDIIKELAGADACIWNLGVKLADTETCRKVSVEYTKSAISAFSSLDSTQKPFRFVFTSGYLSSRDQTKTLWLGQEARRLKGQGETLMMEAEKKGPIVSYVLRPASVLQREMSIRKFVQGLATSIQVSELASAALDLAVNGDGEPHKTIWENNDLVKLGRAKLQQTSVQKE